MSIDDQVSSVAKCDDNVVTITSDDSIKSAVSKMAIHNIGSLLVVDDHGRIKGILTERDIVGKVLNNSKDPKQSRVGSVMTRRVITCSMDTPLVLAQQTMTRHGIRHMPIQEDGKPVGMISNRDILAHQLVTAQNTVREQAEVFANLEAAHPGINRLKHDNSGRIVI